MFFNLLFILKENENRMKMMSGLIVIFFLTLLHLKKKKKSSFLLCGQSLLHSATSTAQICKLLSLRKIIDIDNWIFSGIGNTISQ